MTSAGCCCRSGRDRGNIQQLKMAGKKNYEILFQFIFCNPIPGSVPNSVFLNARSVLLLKRPWLCVLNVAIYYGTVGKMGVFGKLFLKK